MNPIMDSEESKKSINEYVKLKDQISAPEEPIEQPDGLEKKTVFKKFMAYVNKKNEVENVERGNWNNRLEFILSCAGYAIGLGNIWRFPRMVYKYGGGSFLLAYIFILVLLAFPVFFMELSLGQFTSQGPVIIFRRLMPAGEGLGWGTLAGQALSAVYYSGIMSWAIYYFFASMLSPMPWQTCDKEWNNDDCVAILDWFECQGKTGARTNNTYFYHRRCYNETDILDIFKDADHCMQHTAHEKKKEARKSVWTNNMKCRTDITFKFQIGQIDHFIQTDGFKRWWQQNTSFRTKPSDLTIFNASLHSENFVSLDAGRKNSTYMHLNLAQKDDWENAGKWDTFVMKYSHLNLTMLMIYYCNFTNETSHLQCVNKTLNQFDNMSEYASDQFFQDSLNHKDASFTNLMGVKWELGLSLTFTWLIMAFSLVHGPKIMGKIVYFTALFPIVLILIFLIYTAFLDGAQDGYRYYLKTDFNKLYNLDMWHAAAGQIFFSLSIGGGGLMTLASYNRFNNNLLVDGLIVAFSNCITSFIAGFSIFAILGHMAKTMDKDIADIVPSGSSSLAFVGYAHATSDMPVSNLWALLFFFMLIVLAIDSEFAMVETINTFLFDEFPDLRNHRYLTVFSCSFVFLLFSIPSVSRYGSGIVAIVDVPVYDYLFLFVTICEVILIVYVYGVQTFVKDLYMMLGKKDGTQRVLFNKYTKWYYLLTWSLCPFLITAMLIFTWYVQADAGGIAAYLEIPEQKMHPLVYIVFFLMAIGIFVVLTPGFFLYNKYYKGYTWREMFRPLPTWGPSLDINRWGNYETLVSATKTAQSGEEKSE